ncbi:MAG: UDP-N-acetylmuramoyl-tripeptide--D-alanyl-D-alanine ligase [Nitrospirae bacterium]|nr:MAG: UDP-N-acetylmuramoyl-tripeptide--D-alanyl-D-alanine ligase [Nitrospirota bacterium]
MSIYSLKEILDATDGRLISRGPDIFTGLSIDSRTISDGELFIALRGERFDGHDFLDSALEKGGGAVVSYPPVLKPHGKSIIYVSNTLRALQSVARERRLSRSTEVVAVTGTNGKTTTKEMTASVLSRRYRVLSSKGNLNNQIGLPLSLGHLNGEDIAVLEMGASREGDIRELCEIALPDAGVITNVSMAHLEGFGSLEKVKRTKLELLSFIKTLFINCSDPNLTDVPDQFRKSGGTVVTYGINPECDVWAEDVEFSPQGTRFSLHDGTGRTGRVSLRVLGEFNVMNALAASAVALWKGLDIREITEGLSEFPGVTMRVEVREFSGATLISDLYNANPASMEEAVKELIRIKDRRAVAVLGDMLELGAYGEEAHKKLGRWIAGLPVDVLITVGDLTRYTHTAFMESNGKGRKAVHIESADKARDVLREIVEEGDTILVKGSRGMRMERVIEA